MHIKLVAKIHFIMYQSLVNVTVYLKNNLHNNVKSQVCTNVIFFTLGFFLFGVELSLITTVSWLARHFVTPPCTCHFKTILNIKYEYEGQLKLDSMRRLLIFTWLIFLFRPVLSTPNNTQQQTEGLKNVYYNKDPSHDHFKKNNKVKWILHRKYYSTLCIKTQIWIHHTDVLNKFS